MATLAHWCLRHRRWVVLIWIGIFLVGGATVSTTNSRLKFDFSLPGQAGYETSVKIIKTYGTDGQSTPSLLVLTAKPGAKVDDATAAAAFAAVQKAVPSARIIGKAQTGSPIFSTKDGGTQFAYAFSPPQTSFASKTLPQLQAATAANAPPGTTGKVTGIEALANNSSSGGGPGVLVETLLAGVGALAILAFVFASMLALVPILIAAVSILTTFLVLLLLTTIADVSFLVEFLVSLIGLGVAIDYSLLIVTRWREERAHGRENHEAVVIAMETAGHAVLFSGLTVAIGLVSLVVIPVPFLRSIGYGGMLIPLVSVAVATTLLPAMLGGIGPRVDWPRIRNESTASRFWTGWAKLVVRRRWFALALGVILLGALIVPFTNLKIGTAQSASLAKAGPAYEALHVLEDGGMPTGALTPMELLTTSASAPGVVSAVQRVPGVVGAFAPTGPEANRAGTTLSLAVPEKETSGGSSIGVVKAVKKTVKAVPGSVGVSGVGALQLDYLHGVYGQFPLVLGLLVLFTYVLLVRAFRSLLLPLKAVLLNLVSLSATFGGLVLFWQDGHGSSALYGIQPTGAITFWLPLMIFAFLFGLSMDYEVFILARVREEYDATGSTDAAVIEGLGRTGRLVTSAAAILFLSFLSLSSGPQTDIKVFATGLGFGIILDATVVRMLLVPALISILGRWNWYLPDAVAKILRVAPSSSPVQIAAAHREATPVP